jgi:hypothetical protein
MLIRDPVGTMRENKTVHRDYEVAAGCVHVDAPGRIYYAE